MDTQQRNDLLKSVKKGSIIYLSGGDWTSELVKDGEGILDKTWTSNLAHVVFVDEDMNVSESTIEFQIVKTSTFPWRKLNIISGIEITPIDQWAKDDGTRWPWLIVQNFDAMNDNILNAATNKGKDFKARNFFYPVRELVGSLIAYLNVGFAGLFKWINKDAVEKWQQNILKQNNPFDSKTAMYCIAYVDECMMAGNFKIIPDDINDSVSNLGDGMRRKDRAYTLHFISHLGVNDYHKDVGQSFDPNCITNYRQSSI